jgi:pyridoxine 5'-phosphate synthase PdxJ
MVYHKPWQFFIFQFVADDGKHTVSVGAESRIDAVELITGTYSNVRNIRVFKRGDIL